MPELHFKEGNRAGIVKKTGEWNQRPTSTLMSRAWHMKYDTGNGGQSMMAQRQAKREARNLDFILQEQGATERFEGGQLCEQWVQKEGKTWGREELESY